MDTNRKIIRQVNIPIEKFRNNNNNIIRKNNTVNKSFENILKDKINNNQEIKISKHAEIRMNERNIVLTDELKDKINNSVERANEKGVKDSLVLIENNGFIVNIKNRTVVTAFSNEELKESVFTNIDGAVIS
jgi:flagellar operon protein